MSDEPKSQETQLVEETTKLLVDKGRIVEAGWIGFVIACKLKDAPPTQLVEMRRAFFAGATHIFSSMLTFLEAGAEPTEKDMQRMDKLHDELKQFQKELEQHAKRRN